MNPRHEAPYGDGARNDTNAVQGQMARSLPEAGMVRKDTDAETKAAKVLSAAAEHRSLAADQVLLLKSLMPSAKAQWKQLSEGLYQWFRHQGFWPKGGMGLGSMPYAGESGQGPMIALPYAEYVRLKKAEKIALIHSELSEMLEAVRKGDDANEAEELADTQVRILDYVGGFNTPLGDAFEAKIVKNYSRPFRHGKEF